MRYLPVLILFLCACGSKFQFSEKKEAGLLVQVKADALADTAAGRTYNVRIYPEKEVDAKQLEAYNRKMIYGMDSCFYMDEPAGRRYAAVVEPVANGVKGCFEYMVMFDEATVADALTYEDKFNNGKTYQLSLK